VALAAPAAVPARLSPTAAVAQSAREAPLQRRRAAISSTGALSVRCAQHRATAQAPAVPPVRQGTASGADGVLRIAHDQRRTCLPSFQIDPDDRSLLSGRRVLGRPGAGRSRADARGPQRDRRVPLLQQPVAHGDRPPRPASVLQNGNAGVLQLARAAPPSHSSQGGLDRRQLDSFSPLRERPGGAGEIACVRRGERAQVIGKFAQAGNRTAWAGGVRYTAW